MKVFVSSQMPRRGRPSSSRDRRGRLNRRRRARAAATPEVKWLDIAYPYGTSAQIITDSSVATDLHAYMVFAYNTPVPVGTSIGSQAILPVTYVAQGATGNSRIGRQIQALVVDINGYIQMANSINTGASLLQGPCRLTLVHDAASNATVPPVGSTTGSNSIFVNSQGSYSSSLGLMVNMSNRERFTILYDEIFNFGGMPVGGAPQAPTMLEISREIVIPAAYGRVTYSGAGANSAVTGQLWLCATGINSYPTDPAFNAIEFNGTIRLRYTDY